MIESEQVIVRDFINYCKNHFNIEFDMESNIYKKVKNSFERISNDNLPILRLEKKISAKKQDYEDISAPYVRGESYGGYGGGSPIESFKVSYDENIHILRMELQKEISDMAVEKRILEKQLLLLEIRLLHKLNMENKKGEIKYEWIFNTCQFKKINAYIWSI